MAQLVRNTKSFAADRTTCIIQRNDRPLSGKRNCINFTRKATYFQYCGTGVFGNSSYIAERSETKSKCCSKFLRCAFNRFSMCRIRFRDLILWKLNMLIQNTHKALQNFSPSTGDLLKNYLSRKLPTKMALFVCNWIRIDMIKEIGKNI